MASQALIESMLKSPNLPSPPGIVLQVLERASRPDCSMDKLSQLICMDPSLSGKILQTVNSAVFGLSRPISSIQRALAVLGINSARSLVLTLSLPQIYQKCPGSGDMKNYWFSSVGGAIVARHLAKRTPGRDAEDDMAAGLLRDIGIIILQRLFPEAYHQVMKRPYPDMIWDLCEWEHNLCGIDHAEASAVLLSQWRLPKEMTEAVKFHHAPDAGKYTSGIAKDRAYLLYFSSLASQLLATPNQTRIYQELVKLGQEKFDMNQEQLKEFLEPLSAKIKEFADIMQVDIGPVQNYQTVLSQASEQLVQLTLSANLEQQRFQEQKQKAESEARRWREEAVFDPLTKVFNRRFLVSRIQEYIKPDMPRPDFLGILFLDLDGFKPLNDKYGHRFGDHVLVEVANSLRRTVRPGDVVARFGGDEFCILVERIDEKGLRSLSQRIWQEINLLNIDFENNKGKVGVSVGAILFSPSEKSPPCEKLLEAADQAMYHAKRNGKNQVHFLSLATPRAEVA